MMWATVKRKQRGLTQAHLVETVGITPVRFSRIERGELPTSRYRAVASLQRSPVVSAERRGPEVEPTCSAALGR